ncbi:MAG: hypothetical protein ISR96_00025 [Nitrospira sp.]|nr:hypothetical protein [bacterium]MBL7047901.1 hypothetical protein [Nitrospira sp.]
MNRLKAVVTVLLVGVFLSSCATTGGSKDEKVIKVVRISETIAPAKMYEDCIELYPGQVLVYDFEASDFVDFNIHYHAVSGMYHPIEKKGIKWLQGTLSPEGLEYYTTDQEFFCPMWENHGGESVSLSFRGKIIEKKSAGK